MSESEGQARIYCLGHFRIETGSGAEDGGVPTQRKPLLLLKTLIALGGNHVPELQLTDAVWPDADGDSAHSAFASALHRLRQSLGRDALVLSQGRLSLDSRHVWCDQHLFEQHLTQVERGLESRQALECAEHLKQALTLYRGPFLEGEFDPPDILVLRERLHARLLSAVQYGGDLLEQSGLDDRSLALYRQCYDVDPLSEEMVRRVMRGLHARGAATEGLLIFNRFRDALQAAAGADPAPETLALAESHRQSVPSGLETQPAAPADSHVVEPEAASAHPEDIRMRPPEQRVSRTAWAVLGGVTAIAATAVALFVTSAAFEQDPPQQGAPEPSSLAVLPFANLSGDPEQDYFADGITDSLITDLFKLMNLIVIARHSVFAYKGKAVDVREVGRDLDVQYVLEGSVLHTDDRVRVNAQLVDTSSGQHIWAERWDRPWTDILRLQDEISAKIVEELEVKLISGEQARTWRNATTSVEAYDWYLRGMKLVYEFSQENNLLSRRMFEKSLERDPNFAPARAWIATSHYYDAIAGWGESAEESWQQAFDHAQRAIRADPNSAVAYKVLSLVQMDHLGEHEQGIQSLRRAVALDPNYADGIRLLAMFLATTGDVDEALTLVPRYMRLNPTPPFHYYEGTAQIMIMAERYEDAIEPARQCQSLAPDFVWCPAHLAIAYMKLGRTDEAREQVRRLLRINPDYEAGMYLTAISEPEAKVRLGNLLHAAGVP